VLSFSPGTSSYCFYKNNGDDFGLFGQQSGQDCSNDNDCIWADRFSSFSDVEVKYEQLPSQVTVGDEITYRLKIENKGNGDASELALQEVFPANQSVYGAVLSEGSWTCFSSDGGSYCPEP